MTAQEYLKDHNINEETITKFGLKIDGDTIIIPILDENGEHAFDKIRNLKHEEDKSIPKYKNTQGSHATLFNYHAVKDAPNIAITEGELDCMVMNQNGVPAVSSTSGSGSFDPTWAELLQNKKIWICYDNDPAGKEGTRKLLELFPNARVVNLPEGVKDTCEYFTAHDVTEFAGLLRTAQTKAEWQASNFPEEFNIVSAADIDKMEVTEQPWLIDKFIYKEGFCFLFASEGVGKSFLALSIAQAIACGEDWLGKFKTIKGNVLFLDKENPLSMTKRRLSGLGIKEDNIYWLQYPEHFALTNEKGEASAFALALSTIVTTKQIDLIVIDSFVDLVVGNENSSGDTQQFFNAIRQLYPNIAYLALHHENKPSQGVFRSDSQRIRGSTNIAAQVFTSFRLEPVAKSKTELTIKQTKARDAQRLDKFMIRMIVEPTEDGNTKVTGFEYIGDIIEESDDSNKSLETENKIVEILAQTPNMSRKDLLEILSGGEVSQRTILTVIKNMLGAGTLNTFKRGKEVWYSIGMFKTKSEDYEEIANDFGEPL